MARSISFDTPHIRMLTGCSPVLSNSAVGLLMTLLNVYTMQGGEWSITAVITGSIIMAWFAASGALFVYLEMILIPQLKGTLLTAIELEQR